MFLTIAFYYLYFINQRGCEVAFFRLVILTTSLILLAKGALTDELSWRVRFALFSADSEYTDDYTIAGVIDGASRDRDIYDSEKMYPPLSRYALMFFPHRDAAEPDYWPPPYDKDYAHDFRAPLSVKDIWNVKFAMVYPSTATITVWWREMNRMPPSYLPLLISQEGDSFNLFKQNSFTRVFPSGIHRWKLSIEPGYYSSWGIRPAPAVVRVGESIDFSFYLFRPPDSTVCNWASYSFIGSGGAITENGRLSGVFPGSGRVIAVQGGYSDTAEVTILPGTDFNLPLHRGWNLVSLPCNPGSRRVFDLMPGFVGNIYYFNNLSRLYVEADSLIPGKGYFVLSTRDTNITINGAVLDSVGSALGVGWNLIGGTSYMAHLTDFTTSPAGLLHGFPQIWESSAYFEADSFEPYRGFWILSTGSGAISIITD